jgi:Na+-transporting NADH:ubiquinone oxidoreductase subunit C
MAFDPNKSPAYVVIYAAIISAIFTGGIMGLYVLTRPKVLQNEKVMRQKAIVEVFGLGDVTDMSDRQITDTYAAQILRYPLDDAGELAYYFAFKADAGPSDKPFAYAIPLHGVGFWAPIRGLLAVDVKTRKAIGVAFLAHSETPGLGGRITEKDFRRRWVGLTLTPPTKNDKWIYITKTKPTGPNDPAYGRHVDALSGATGTSTAVMNFTNRNLSEYLNEGRNLAEQVTRDDIKTGNLPPLRGEGIYQRGGV